MLYVTGSSSESVSGGVSSEECCLEPKHRNQHLIRGRHLHAPVRELPDKLADESGHARISLRRPGARIDDGCAASNLCHLQQGKEFERLLGIVHRSVVEVLRKIRPLLLGDVAESRQRLRAGDGAIADAEDVRMRMQVALALALAGPQHAHAIIHKQPPIPIRKLVRLVVQRLRKFIRRDTSRPYD